MHTARIIVGTVLALALSGISIVCCYIFGTHLAPGDEGRLYGVLGAVADGFKAILPIGIAVALASKQRARAAVGIVLFLVFTAYSFASELGLYALSRDAQATSATARKENLAFLKAEREPIRERLKALGQTRPSGTIRRYRSPTSKQAMGTDEAVHRRHLEPSEDVLRGTRKARRRACCRR